MTITKLPANINALRRIQLKTSLYNQLSQRFGETVTGNISTKVVNTIGCARFVLELECGNVGYRIMGQISRLSVNF